VDRLPTPEPDATLVTVFSTDDPGLLALAAQALRESGIEAVVGPEGRFNPLEPLHPRVGMGALHGPSGIVVREEDAARARALLADFEGPESVEVVPAGSMPPVEVPAEQDVTLTDDATGAVIGRISDAQLRVLVDLLEEAFEDSQSYYIDGPTIEMLEGARADAALTQMLRTALGPRDSMDVRWSRPASPDPA
jgi:processive 1,2-diacylglycerol beta-glucosyltransferase